MRVPFARVLLAEVGAVALVAQHDRGAVVVGGGRALASSHKGGDKIARLRSCVMRSRRITPPSCPMSRDRMAQWSVNGVPWAMILARCCILQHSKLTRNYGLCMVCSVYVRAGGKYPASQGQSKRVFASALHCTQAQRAVVSRVGMHDGRATLRYDPITKQANYKPIERCGSCIWAEHRISKATPRGRRREG